MATEVIIPALGVVVEKVKILKWLKAEGEAVKEGEPLLEIESEKVTMELPSPASGILGCILYAEGDEVAITKVAAVILADGEPLPEAYRRPAEKPAPETGPTVSLSPASPEATGRPVRAVPVARKLATARGVDLGRVTATGPHGTIMKKDVVAYLAAPTTGGDAPRASTLARRAAEELRIPLEGIEGTGTRGRIMQADVVKAAKAAEPLPAEEEGFGRVIPMNSMRQVIARRMCESAFTAPHIHFFSDIHMGSVLALREAILKDFEKEFAVRPSVNDFLIKAVAMAIRRHPLFNGRIVGNEVHVQAEINVGMAVALPEGLIVPSIPRADRLGLGAIARIRADLVDRARKGKLTPQEIGRGTFTVSSLASFDVDFFTAILNPPESGILSVGRTQDQLYLDGEQVKSRKIATVGLSVDHRIIDGAVAAAFLQTVKRTMENATYAFLNL
jgi:pyruvate dehydrogenase E2 component (dihydrolipoamide acetyltransferase)